MNDIEIQLSREIACILDHAVIRAHDTSNSVFLLDFTHALDKAEAACLEMVSTRGLGLEVERQWAADIKRRVAEWKTRLMVEKQAKFETIESMHDHLLELGDMEAEDKAYMEILAALHCKCQPQDDPILRTLHQSLSADVSNICNRTIIHFHRMKRPVDELPVAFDEARTTCMALVASRALEPAVERQWQRIIERRIAHRVMMESFSLDVPFDQVQARHEQAVGLGYTWLLEEGYTTMSFARYCEVENRDEIVRQVLAPFYSRIMDAIKRSSLDCSYLAYFKQQAELLLVKVATKQTLGARHPHDAVAICRQQYIECTQSLLGDLSGPARGSSLCLACKAHCLEHAGNWPDAIRFSGMVYPSDYWNYGMSGDE